MRNPCIHTDRSSREDAIPVRPDFGRLLRSMLLTVSLLLVEVGCSDVVGLTSPDEPSEQTPTAGPLISDVQPAEYETDTLSAGIAVYIDRDYTVEGAPSSYDGWVYVRPANDDKGATGESAVTFTLGDSATVALAYDERATTLPSWLIEKWTATGDTLRTTNVDHVVFTREFGSGDVTLGGNMSGGAAGAETNYVLFAAGFGSGADGDPTGSGALEVTTSTSGDETDPDGYTVILDGGAGRPIGTDASTTYSDLAPGDHEVELSGVAVNCSVRRSNPRTVSVPESGRGSTAFEVSCSDGTKSSADYPNEPSGYSRIFEFDGSGLPPDFGTTDPICNTSAALSGCYVGDSKDAGSTSIPNGTGTLISDPTAPIDDNVLRVTWKKGLSQGTPPGWWNMWGPSGSVLNSRALSEQRPDGYELEEMYMSRRVKLTSGPGDGMIERVAGMGSLSNQEGPIKFLGYMSVGDDDASEKSAQIILKLRGGDWDESSGLASTAHLRVEQQGPESLDEPAHLENTGPSGSAEPVIQVGVWHHYEFVAKLNTIGHANGVLKVWVDGNLILDRNDVTWRTASDPRGFFGMHWSPVNGGGDSDDPSKSRDDHLDIDHVYISGIELSGVNG